MWLKWLPWRYVVGSVARAHGFIDPVGVLARLYRFAEPSEVGAPIELLRAGLVFHARGLMNTGAIQHNLDWVWPYWVQRQFDPKDVAFIPRSFSVTHVNLTHRNWTAVGLPQLDWLPIVDPRGLVTPHWDGWSLDGWIMADDASLVPSRCDRAEQRLTFDPDLAVVTTIEQAGLRWAARTQVVLDAAGEPVCRQTWTAASDRPAWFAVALRPCNPEGVSFVHHLELDQRRRRWTVDQIDRVEFVQTVERHAISSYRQGDVFLLGPSADDRLSLTCEVGMVTAAAFYRLEPGLPRTIEVAVPLSHREAVAARRQTPWLRLERRRHRPASRAAERPSAADASWDQALAGRAEIRLPDARFQFLYEAAIRTLVLHSPGEIYAGPYTYKRFWVRDAAFILHALLCAGLVDRVGRLLPALWRRQNREGYFVSQEGEWDSNGQALWILQRYSELSGRRPPPEWRHAITRAARWIVRKRLSSRDASPHAGLLPPGFSAEHLGPNDYYYWDDFWAVAGLRAAAALLEQLAEPHDAARNRSEADDLLDAVRRSLAQTEPRRLDRAMPASPYRRFDSGAIGSLAAGYPLQLFEPRDPRLLDTVAELRSRCFVDGGFFQDMIHSGINAYLTLHVAQVMLRSGDPRWFEPVEAIAELASPTGQWPEAIHPATHGGCMGDGQHAWAAAEWVMAMRNAFVREESDRLVLVSGIPAAWLVPGSSVPGQSLEFGPAPTPWGPLTLAVQGQDQGVMVRWHGTWRAEPPHLEICPAGCQPQQLASPPPEGELMLRRTQRATDAADRNR